MAYRLFRQCCYKNMRKMHDDWGNREYGEKESGGIFSVSRSLFIL